MTLTSRPQVGARNFYIQRNWWAGTFLQGQDCNYACVSGGKQATCTDPFRCVNAYDRFTSTASYEGATCPT